MSTVEQAYRKIYNVLLCADTVEYKMANGMLVRFRRFGHFIKVVRSDCAGLLHDGTWEEFSVDHLPVEPGTWPTGSFFPTMTEAWEAFISSKPEFKV